MNKTKRLRYLKRIPRVGVLFVWVSLAHGQMFPSDSVLRSRGFERVDTLAGVRKELIYSTDTNFLHENIYRDYNKVWLHKDAAKKLKRALQLLKEECARCELLIFDGLRPRRAQVQMRSVAVNLKKGIYVSRAWPGSVHNFGMAIDLTLLDSAGKSLDMGTTVDYLGPLAQPALEDSLWLAGALSFQQIENRRRLRRLMTRAGWVVLPSEWWHFNARLSQEVRQNYRVVE